MQIRRLTIDILFEDYGSSSEHISALDYIEVNPDASYYLVEETHMELVPAEITVE